MLNSQQHRRQPIQAVGENESLDIITQHNELTTKDAVIFTIEKELKMYKKQEAAAIRRKFWTTFGIYMKPVPSSWLPQVNWLNYKTGIKDVFFRLHADGKMARICIEITHKDPMIRKIFYDHFTAMKTMLHDALEEEWNWIEDTEDELGKPLAAIYQEITGVNVMDEKSWPQIIAFFKPRFIALDSFWGEVKDSMEGW